MLYFFIIQDNGKTRRSNSLFVIIWGVVSITVASPWLIFNYYRFGNLIQDSASATTIILLRELFIGYEADFLTYIRLVILDIGRILKFLIPDYSGYPFFLLIILLFFGLYISITWKEKKPKYFIAIYYIFLIYTVLLHSIRIYPREYYFAPFIDLFILTLAILLNSAFSNENFIIDQKQKKILLLLLTILCIAIPIYTTHANVLEGPQDISFTAYNTLNQNITPFLQKENQQVFGASDSGILGWFWVGSVVNLDGLVNHDAYNYIKEGNMISFLRQYQIQFFIIRPPWMNEWYMGNGSGLWYVSLPIIPSKTEQNEIIPYSHQFRLFRDHLEIQKLLMNNFDITTYYYNSTIMPYDRTISHYLGYGWRVPCRPEYRVEDNIDTNWFPFTLHYSQSNDYATSKGKESNIYLPLKLNESYRVNLSLSLNTKQESNISKIFIIDNQTQITTPILPNITNLTLNITATHDVTHIIMSNPDNEQDSSSVNLWGIYITNLSDTTTQYQ